MKKTNIQNRLAFLNEVRSLTESGQKITSEVNKKLTKKHMVSGGLISTAYRAGFFTKAERGFFKCNVANFEPIHVRKISEFERSLSIVNKTAPKRESIPVQKRINSGSKENQFRFKREKGYFSSMGSIQNLLLK